MRPRTLVAIISSVRGMPRCFIHFPIIVSETPPGFSSTQREYMSAVSMKLTPALKEADSTSNESASLTDYPNCIVPKHSSETFKPVRPRLRYSMMGAPLWGDLRLRKFSTGQ